MKRKSILWLLLACFIANGALAASINAANSHTELNWVATLSIGSAWENEGSTQTFYLAPQIEKTYTANQLSHALLEGEIFLGLQTKLSHFLIGQLGLAVAKANNATLSGDIWDDADPQFDNYSYSYKINHKYVAVKGKLLADMQCCVMPWLSGSVGVGINRAYDYTNTPSIEEALPNPNFTFNTETAFSYTLGAGLQKALNNHWTMGVGYEFADWGKSSLGSAPAQTLNSGIALSHFYTNSVLFNLTYIA